MRLLVFHSESAEHQPIGEKGYAKEHDGAAVVFARYAPKLSMHLWWPNMNPQSAALVTGVIRNPSVSLYLGNTEQREEARPTSTRNSAGALVNFAKRNAGAATA